MTAVAVTWIAIMAFACGFGTAFLIGATIHAARQARALTEVVTQQPTTRGRRQ